MEAVKDPDPDAGFVAEPAAEPEAGRVAGQAAGSELSSFLDLLLIHQQCVLSLCLGYARDSAQAEEWAQEAYLKALKNASGLRDPGAAKVWLCRIAKHTCLDQLKRERLGREALAGAFIFPPPSRR